MKRIRKRFMAVLVVLLSLLYLSWWSYGANWGEFGPIIYVGIGMLLIFVFSDKY